MTREEMKNLKAGDVVECITGDLNTYTKGSWYIIGTDSYGDFGVLLKESDKEAVYSEGCIHECVGDEGYECFNPDDWILIDSIKEGLFSYDLNVYEYSFVGEYLVVAKKKEIK